MDAIKANPAKKWGDTQVSTLVKNVDATRIDSHTFKYLTVNILTQKVTFDQFAESTFALEFHDSQGLYVSGLVLRLGSSTSSFSNVVISLGEQRRQGELDDYRNIRVPSGGVDIAIRHTSEVRTDLLDANKPPISVLAEAAGFMRTRFILAFGSMRGYNLKRNHSNVVKDFQILEILDVIAQTASLGAEKLKQDEEKEERSRRSEVHLRGLTAE